MVSRAQAKGIYCGERNARFVQFQKKKQHEQGSPHGSAQGRASYAVFVVVLDELRCLFSETN